MTALLLVLKNMRLQLIRIHEFHSKLAGTLINKTFPPRELTLLWESWFYEGFSSVFFPACSVEATCWVSAGTSEWEEPSSRSLTGHKAVWADNNGT